MVGIPKPTKDSRPGIQRRKEIKRKDAEVQRAVSCEGNCFNCGEYKSLGGDHAIKRRYLATRHDLKNIRPCCWPCNVALESLSAKQLLARFPLSPLREEWNVRMQK
ncbi:MAG: hypothetical protein JWP89_2607 [Schlesneria sp.]|nr:hypothetical protein [Schlesneria sp.]